jgi:hypothetical protein
MVRTASWKKQRDELWRTGTPLIGRTRRDNPGLGTANKKDLCRSDFEFSPRTSGSPTLKL